LLAVIVERGWNGDDENVEAIPERLDFIDPAFGVTRAKSHPPFVFGIRGVSCLVHRVAYVDLHWWRIGGPGGSSLVKLKKPLAIATCVCAQHFRLESDICRTCRLPDPKALLCGRCHGEIPPFGRHGAATKAGITRQEAHVKLGCAVQGY
jgi:hypothetical protein